MPQDSNKPNEIRMKSHSDVRIRSYFSSCVMHELQANYMHQISLYPILTPDEETKWTRQHHEAKKELHNLLEQFPLLIISVLNSLVLTQNHLKLERYFLTSDPADDEGKQKLHTLFDEVIKALAQISIENMPKGTSIKKQKLAEFNKIFHQLSPKNTFYQLCLDRLSDEKFRESFISQDKWQSLHEEITRLQQSIKEAANTLVEHNLRLVISIAGHYVGTSIPLADLVQEGNIGLMRAVDKFDFSLGHRFTTYASYWIRQAITKYITNHSRIIRMPANTVAQISAIKQAEQQILTETGQLPTPEQLAPIVGFSVAKIIALQKMIQQPLSLHAMIDDDNTLEDSIADPTTSSQSSETELNNLRESLNQVLSTLDERESTVIRLNFGLDDGKCLTLAEISKLLGVSSERVRQIKGNAIQKMRVPKLLNQLDGF